MTVRKRSVGPEAGLPIAAAPAGLPADLALRAVGFDLLDHPWRDLHHHDALELGYCHAGVGVFLVDGRLFPFRAGDALVVAPGVLHRARSEAGSTSRWTFCWLDPARLLAGSGAAEVLRHPDGLCGPRFPAILDSAEHPEACALVRLLAAEAAGRRDPEVARGLAWAAMAALHRLPGTGRRHPGRAADLARLAPALALLGGGGMGLPPVAALAARCRMSPATFRRACHRALGVGPRGFALRLRIERAAGLLVVPGTGVLEVALATGFASANGFARRFRAVLGVGPRAWRSGRK